MEYNKGKLIPSLVLCSSYITYGLAFSMVGPTLLDLQELTDTNTGSISIILIAKPLGGMLGAAIGGTLISRINPWILVSVALCLCGILNFFVALCRTLVRLAFTMAFICACGSLFDSVGNLQLINIWGDQHGPWMQALHCVFGIGALLGPLIATPFLSKENYVAKNVDLELNTTTVSLDRNTETNVKYAYFIGGGLLIIHGLMFVILFLKGKRNFLIKEATVEKEERNIWKGYNKCFLISFSTLLFMFYVTNSLLEINYAYYLATYTVEELNWTKTAGATLTSVFFAAFTFGRAVGIFIIKYFQTETLLLSMSFFTCIWLIPQVFFISFHKSIMWVSTAFFGLSMSTLFAAGLTFGNKYIPLSDGFGALFIAAGSLGNLIGPALIVPLFNDYGWTVFIGLMFTASIVMLISVVLGIIIGKRHGGRNTGSKGETVSLRPAVDLGTEANDGEK